MTSQTFETLGVQVAVEGCGHGTLNAIYAAVDESCKARSWDGVDVLIIGGDFQAVRNAADLTIMSCPPKYRAIGDFHQYYSGARTAPYLTIFIAGNHEASSHLWELYYGGWVAPNIYYLGAANVLRLGPLRIAGMSGIWKGFDYRKVHHERLPFSSDDVKSFYHVRELDVRKLLLLQTQVDIGLSHDWPRAVEKFGDMKGLWRIKPFFEKESQDGTLGNVAAEYVMDRLRPPYWFSAHMHCKFSALKKYEDEPGGPAKEDIEAPISQAVQAAEVSDATEANPDEIDLDDDDDVDGATEKPPVAVETNGKDESDNTTNTAVPDELRAQLPASFTRPPPQPKTIPGQPVPHGITNKEVRFLALDKCTPGRHFLQLCEIHPYGSKPTTEAATESSLPSSTPRYHLEYDPEWLAIIRVFHNTLTFGDRQAQPPPDIGEAKYLPLIEAERAWVEKNIVATGKLAVPENFEITAPPHVEGSPEQIRDQPEEYSNPQTKTFCELLELGNIWDASQDERMTRKAQGPPPSEFRGGGRGGRGRGGGRGFGGGRGRGGGDREHGRGRGRGFY